MFDAVKKSRSKLILQSGSYVLYTITLVLLSSLIAYPQNEKAIVGAERLNEYLPLLKNKKIAIVANQTSMVGKVHLVDTLLHAGIKIKCVFAPEHINNGVDQKTNLPIISLYGKHQKPTETDLSGVEFMVFDIQDVGTRFFTYISTLQYVMEACAQKKIPLLVLDRPNPNGFYVDGPILDKKFASFVGMNPIPIVHGLTVAEYALMLNGENWLAGNLKCELFYVKSLNWDHSKFYVLPIRPSPNLPNMTAIYLYPSLCLFEGTKVSVGRGTELPFQIAGWPGFKSGTYHFTPQSKPGVAAKPIYEGIECSGFDLRAFGDTYIKTSDQLYLLWLMGMYESDSTNFFNPFFEKLAGTDQLRIQIQSGMTEEVIFALQGFLLVRFRTNKMNYNFEK
jgi:uncharacterized protein YbbC (DUF1343 family)